MAKKKKSQKKKFRSNRAQLVATPRKEATELVETTADQPEVTESNKKAAPAVTSQFSYVKHEIFHSVWLIAGILVVYIILWYLYEYTALGPMLNNLIKI